MHSYILACSDVGDAWGVRWSPFADVCIESGFDKARLLKYFQISHEQMPDSPAGVIVNTPAFSPFTNYIPCYTPPSA